MKDDLAPLSAFGLVDDEEVAPETSSAPTSFWDSWSFRSSKPSRKLKKIVMLGSKDVSAVVDDRLRTRPDLLLPGSEEVTATKAQEDEPAIIKQIQDAADVKLAELEPMIQSVESFIKQNESGASTSGQQPPTASDDAAPNPRTLVFVSEALLQALLKLDSIDIPSSYADARAERKKGVKTLQAALDRVDSLKDEFKAVSARVASQARS